MMGWTERQAAMLKEMGLRVEVDAMAASAPVATAVEPVAPPAPSPRPTSTRPAVPMPSTPTPTPIPSSPTPTPSPSASQTSTTPAGLAIARMDWAELRSSVAACSVCKLCQGRTQTVFGVGSVQADWLVVGEAPGEQEDAQGEPFVGKSGQLLDNMLRAIGVSRDASGSDPARQAYIANSVKCRPPGNRNPAPDELAQCEPI